VFDRVLIANRGEIAVRIIRACRELGVRTIAVYSAADADSLHVRLADKALCIGPPPARDSYLNVPNLIEAAVITGADAIHPGYGFLAENANFAEVVERCKLKWIGPPASAIEQMGDKASARNLMAGAGVPIVPGSRELVKSNEQAASEARELGYPVIIKASAGGGGKGMRACQNESELLKGMAAARAEAEAAFGSGDLYLEKYIAEPRHVEVQLLADAHGNTVHLWDRDCSIQTARHQKMLEEGPSRLPTNTRSKLGEAAVKGARAVGYTNAGTMEFLVDHRNNFYFMEMNTRIQVEHPVTEMITGIDLVKEQIRVAAGEKLSFRQRNIHWTGHAIECRITAEDPGRSFAPSAGKVTNYLPPGGPGVRMDSHLYPGYEVPPFYDSLLAKIVVHGADRDEAIRRMERALSECVLEGVRTTRPFHERILANQFYRRGEVFTNFIQRRMDVAG